MASVFIKVHVSERLPKENDALKDGVYIVIESDGFCSSAKFGHSCVTHRFEWSKSDVEYWLEEIELPTEEELNEGNPYPDEDDCATIWAFADGFREGANFILDKLKGGKND